MLYLLLSVLSLVPEVALQVAYLFVGTPTYSPAVSAIVWIWVLMGRQICLLCVNLFYVRRGMISLIRSITSMLAIIVLSVGLMLGFHRMQYGVFVGDVPEGIYCFLIIAPSVVIFAGVAIYQLGVALYKLNVALHKLDVALERQEDSSEDKGTVLLSGHNLNKAQKKQKRKKIHPDK